ncbi:hypothetical protein LVJ83_04780 [Uruburuella testudinis]|uniref:Transposase n=1 Tax=Uruburuella testudinis TaxID=1282863 RepID=A0ABY4DVP5_9NEIS|nr:hypothetical protein [Uruburuella testudinis]UOO82784.1 hypothetical protein LVJ83_04780 [Uruburuella testudinis]
MRVERDYSRIRAGVSRHQSGHLVCELSGTNGVLLLTLVAHSKQMGVEEVVQTALRCLSQKDLRKAV